jgi:voltage-gated potassium channel Kch
MFKIIESLPQDDDAICALFNAVRVIGYYKAAQSVQAAFDADSISERQASVLMALLHNQSLADNGRAISNAVLH